MRIKQLILGRKDVLVEICRRYHVIQMFAFGSSTNNQFDDATSDVDLMVSVDIEEPSEKGIALLNLWDDLEIFFGRTVDLVTEDSVHNPYLKANLFRTRILIYDREREEILG